MKKNLKITILKKIKNLNSLLLITILLSFVHLFDGFENTFKILIRPYETRMQLTHGYCQNESYGFYSDVVKKFQINKYKVYQETYCPIIKPGVLNPLLQRYLDLYLQVRNCKAILF